MAFRHGKDAEIVVNQYDVTGLFNEVGYSVENDTAETTTFRQDWKTHIAGLNGGEIELSGFYDTVRSDEIKAYVGQETPIVATIGPAGLKVGDFARMMRAQSTAYEESSPVGDVVSMSWTLMSTEEVFHGYALKDVEAGITGDGTGAAVDTGAAVTGATWALQWHIAALSATNLTITVEDSADGTTGWAPIAGVTSGAQTVAGSGRVTGVGTVRRHVRVAHDVNGGASTATYTAAFARRA